MTVRVDLYCERVGAGLMAEPLNALSNVAFLVAAWAAWTLAERARALDPGIGLLIALLLTIGIGSTLFHTFATPWAYLLDIAPIVLFQAAYLWIYGRRVMRVPGAWVASFVPLFVAAAWMGRQAPHLLNGSLTYVPAVALGVSLGIYHYRHTPGARRFELLLASGVLVVSVVFRTIDRAVCAAFPLGTHFVWHLLIPVVAYLYVRALIPVAGALREA